MWPVRPVWPVLPEWPVRPVWAVWPVWPVRPAWPDENQCGDRGGDQRVNRYAGPRPLS